MNNYRSSGFRAVIDIAQLKELYDIASNTLTKDDRRFIVRLAVHIHENFIKQDVRGRIDFLCYCVWALKRRIIVLGKRARLITVRPKNHRRPMSQISGLRVAVNFAGSLGDMIQQIPFVIKFNDLFHPELLDLFVDKHKLDDRAALAFSGLPFKTGVFSVDLLDEVSPESAYDLRIDMKHIVCYTIRDMRHIRKVRPKLPEILEIARHRFEPYRFIFENHPRFDGLFGRLMAAQGLNAVEAAGYFGGIPVQRDDRPPIDAGDPARRKVQTLGLGSRRYITIHDGQDVNNLETPGRIPTRSWPLSHWERLIDLIRSAHPEFAIIQLGTRQHARMMKGADRYLFDDEVGILEVAAIIENSSLHVDVEGGLVRVAWAFGIPTVSIQGPSGSKFFEFESVTSVVSSFCSDCWRVKSDWMLNCLLGFDKAECMFSIQPETVMHEVARLLQEPARHPESGPAPRPQDLPSPI